jgi:hypothetical protein
MHTRKDLAAGAALAAAVIAAAVTYAILAVHPWPASPLSQFLATFGQRRGLADADRVVPGRGGGRRAGAVAGAPLLAADLHPGNPRTTGPTQANNRQGGCESPPGRPGQADREAREESDNPDPSDQSRHLIIEWTTQL